MTKKKTYKVTIEETVSDTFEIIAENDEQARASVEEKYYNGDIVLCPGYLLTKKWRYVMKQMIIALIGLNSNGFTF